MNDYYLEEYQKQQGLEKQYINSEINKIAKIFNNDDHYNSNNSSTKNI